MEGATALSSRESFDPVSLGTLPPETQMNIFLDLPIASFLNLCQTSKVFAGICADEYFWMIKFQHDFPGMTGPPDDKWHNHYVGTVLAKKAAMGIYFLNVIYNGKRVGKLWVNQKDNLAKIASNIEKTFPGVIVNWMAYALEWSHDKPDDPISLSEKGSKVFERWFKPPNLPTTLFVSDREIKRDDFLEIVDPRRGRTNFWLLSESTVGELIDKGKELKPDATRIYFSSTSGGMGGYKISDLPEIRSERVTDFFERETISFRRTEFSSVNPHIEIL